MLSRIIFFEIGIVGINLKVYIWTLKKNMISELAITFNPTTKIYERLMF